MIELFLTFLKLGLFTFGGGYAMIPLIKETIINKKGWMSEDEVIEMIAIAESTPGPIAINMATYIGYKQKGFLGSLFSTLGVILPSLIIIFLISLCFDMFIANKYIAYAFMGIKCGVAILILKTGIEMLLKSDKNIVNIAVFSIVTILMIVLDILAINLSAIILILMGGLLVGVVGKTIKEKIDNNSIDSIVASVYNSKPTTPNENVKNESVDDSKNTNEESVKTTTYNSDLDAIENLVAEMQEKEILEQAEKERKENEGREHIDTISSNNSKSKKIKTKEKSLDLEKDNFINLENMFGSSKPTQNQSNSKPTKNKEVK